MSATATATPGLRARLGSLSSTAIVYLVLLVAIAVGAALTATVGRNFFSSGNVSAILTATSILGLVAIGQTLVILVGSLDLSVPYVVSLASLVGGTTMAGESGNIVPAVMLTLAVAAAIGLANGLVVSQLHVHGFIATLGVGLVVSGYLGTNYQGSSGSAPKEFRAVDEASIGPLPVSVLIMLALAAVVFLMLSRTRIGHHMYAVGGSPEVARLSGLRTSPPVVLAHVLCSVLAGIAGLLLLSRLSVGSPTIGSQGGYDLLSIAAVVLGGTLLAGGRGGIVGTLGGVAIFAVMDSTMGALQVNPFLKDVVRGVIIIAAVAVYARRNLQVRPTRFDRSVPPAAAGTTPQAQEVR